MDLRKFGYLEGSLVLIANIDNPHLLLEPCRASVVMSSIICTLLNDVLEDLTPSLKDQVIW